MRIFVILLFLSVSTHLVAQNWAPTGDKIKTRWADEVTPENVWAEYPRPQMQRKEWLNLNGLWDYAVRHVKDKQSPKKWDGKILVPFSIEAPLSGVAEQVSENDVIWYKRTFSIPKDWKNKKLLLHIEASDYETTVWLNEHLIGSNLGGYSPFSFELNKAIIENETQILTVKVYDPQNNTFKSLGKQANNVNQYERCSGIWQTVWLEPVSEKASIESIKIKANLEEVSVELNVDQESEKLKVIYEIFESGSMVASITAKVGEKINLIIPFPKLWSPETPFLYDLNISLLDGTQKIDEVKSYFGMRTVELFVSENGTDVLLNGNPIFQMGPLDQNYWPDGGLTPPSDEAMKWEVEYLKRIGCNMVRLHIKQNPRRFYYHCDRIGLLVWQDFISSQKSNRNPSPKESDSWFEEQEQLIEKLFNHPSIIMWVVFNEAWGQHNTKEIFEKVKQLDSSRLLNIASGWYDVPEVGDIRDIHDYTFRPAIPVLDNEHRVVVLGECGGFASAVPPHNWTGRSNKSGQPKNPLFGGFDPEIPRDDDMVHDLFRPTFTHGEAFQNQYKRFIEHLHILQNTGLRAAVYTQMTDMKLEENGWLTFDREISKIHPDSLGKIHNLLYTTPPIQNILLPPSLEIKQSWKVATIPIQKVKDKAKELGVIEAVVLQEKPDFKSLTWKEETGPFGNTTTPLTGINWNGKSQLIIQKSINIDNINKDFTIRIYTKMEGDGMPWMHTRIYINDKFVADETTRQKMPELRMSEVMLPAVVKKYLKKGKNILTLQFVPGLVSRSGKILPVSENVFVDVAFTEIEKQ